MEKVCFLLRIKPQAVDDYVDRHINVWPELLEALHNSGYRNYSIFVEDDGLLVGYMETEDFEASLASLHEQEISHRWSEFMDELFIPVDKSHPVGSLRILRKGFDLDEARERSGASTG